MPIYTYACQGCGSVFDKFTSKSATIETTPALACECGTDANRIPHSSMVGALCFTGHKGVRMPDAQGTWIEDGAQYKKYLKDNNQIPASEAAGEAERSRANALAADDKARKAAVVAAVQKLST